jgi:hypothetical protein
VIESCIIPCRSSSFICISVGLFCAGYLGSTYILTVNRLAWQLHPLQQLRAANKSKSSKVLSLHKIRLYRPYKPNLPVSECHTSLTSRLLQVPILRKSHLLRITQECLKSNWPNGLVCITVRHVYLRTFPCCYTAATQRLACWAMRVGLQP